MPRAESGAWLYIRVCWTQDGEPAFAFKLGLQVLVLFLISASQPFLMQLSVFDLLGPIRESPKSHRAMGSLGASPSMLPDFPHLLTATPYCTADIIIMANASVAPSMPAAALSDLHTLTHGVFTR